jgi:hypothetical protein
MFKSIGRFLTQFPVGVNSAISRASSQYILFTANPGLLRDWMIGKSL